MQDQVVRALLTDIISFTAAATAAAAACEDGGASDSSEVADQLACKLNNLLQVAGTRKEAECEHLRGIISELSASRVEAIRLKVLGMESYSRLQEEHLRAVRSAQLAHEISRLNFSKASARQKQVVDLQDELRKERALTASLQAQLTSLKGENDGLRRRATRAEGMVDAAQGPELLVRSCSATHHGCNLFQLAVLY